jgi:hypothetical protein
VPPDPSPSEPSPSRRRRALRRVTPGVILKALIAAELFLALTNVLLGEWEEARGCADVAVALFVGAMLGRAAEQDSTRAAR